MRRRALEVLETLRAQKRALLARSPDVLRKSSARRPPAQPARRGLPVDNVAAKTMVAEARSRGIEEQRLAKTSGQAASGQAALTTLKAALRSPIVGDRGLIGFLNGGR